MPERTGENSLTPAEFQQVAEAPHARLTAAAASRSNARRHCSARSLVAVLYARSMLSTDPIGAIFVASSVAKMPVVGVTDAGCIIVVKTPSSVNDNDFVAAVLGRDMSIGVGLGFIRTFVAEGAFRVVFRRGIGTPLLG